MVFFSKFPAPGLGAAMEVEETPPPPTGGGMAGGVDGGARTMKRFKHLKRSFVEVTVDSPNLENDTPARVEESNSFDEEITVDSDKEDDPSDGDCGIPVVEFSKQFREELIKPWKNALLVK